jgi:hypothetical protein
VVATNTNGCVSSSVLTIQVDPVPVVTITGNTSICSGKSATLTANGASTFLWNNILTGNSIVVSPNISTAYSVIGFNSPVCRDSTSIMVNVTPSPTIQVTGNFTICQGESTLLTATGASSYLWSNNATSAIIGVTPLNTVSYVVVGSNGNCSNSKTVTIVVDACTDINHSGLTSGLKIYPNPAKDNLIIECDNQEDISLYNNLGMLVWNRKFHSGINHVNIAELSAGIYLIKSAGREKTRVIRTVKSE